MWRQFLVLLLLTNPVLLRKSGGRGGGKGGSGVRGSVRKPPGGRPPVGRPPAGRAPGGRSFGGRGTPSGSGRYPGTGFHPGYGPGSYSSGKSFRNALIGGALGAVGGMLAFEAGKAIIQSMSTPFNYNGQNYYWDQHPNVRNSDIECSLSIDELQKLSGSDQQPRAKRQLNSSTTTSPSPTTMAPDDILNNLQYPNGTRPQRITWVCKRQYEVCCGTDCCPSDADSGLQSIGWVIGIIAALVLAACCCFGICYVLKNTAERNQRHASMMPHHVHNIPSPNDSNCVQPNPYASEPHHDQYTNSYDSQQGYPQYPQHGYPQYPQHGYPQYPQQGYPQYPQQGYPPYPQQGHLQPYPSY